MSMFRKTVLTTAIVGAGLASTAGAAFAGDCPSSEGHASHASHEKSHHGGSKGGCSNATQAENSSEGKSVIGDVFGGGQRIVSQNLCDNLNGNSVLSNNNVSLLGNIHNGDTTETSSSASTAQGTNAASSAPAASATPAGATTTPIRG